METYISPVDSNLEFAQHDSSSSYATLLLSNKVLTTSQYALRTGLRNRISNGCKLTIVELDGQSSQVVAAPIDYHASSNQRKGGRTYHV